MDDGSKDVTTEVAQGIKTLKENISKGGNFPDIKGIVSRDWAELEMILLERSEVFSVSATHFFKILLLFSYSIFKNGRLSCASFPHSSSNDQYSSGDSNSLA